LFSLPGVRLFLTIFFFNSSSIIPPFHVSNIQSEPQDKKGTVIRDWRLEIRRDWWRLVEIHRDANDK
jgi:hypothetical protein